MNADQIVDSLERGCSINLPDALGTYWSVFISGNRLYLALLSDDGGTLEKHTYENYDDCLGDMERLAPFAQWLETC
jgi:hypothetical protein